MRRNVYPISAFPLYLRLHAPVAVVPRNALLLGISVPWGPMRRVWWACAAMALGAWAQSLSDPALPVVALASSGTAAVAAVAAVVAEVAATTAAGATRRLQFEDFVINSMHMDAPSESAAEGGKGGKRGKKRGSKAAAHRPSRAHVFSTTVDQILVEADRYHMWWTGPAVEPTVPFSPADWAQPHRKGQNAIFTSTILQGLGDHSPCSSPNDLVLYLGSARRVFQGDIVVALDAAQLTPQVRAILVHYRAVVYVLPRGLCSKESKSIFCGSADERVPATVFRYYFYEKWAAAYADTSLLMVTDFRDVFFQADPFATHLDEWRVAGAEHDLAVFQEFAPTMRIARCAFNRKVMGECYGDEALRQLGGRVVLSSGAVLGSRSGILVWTHFITRQLQDAPGRQVETRCYSGGVDHAFVNWLVYGNKLRPFMRIRVFAHGDGPVNTLGGLRPDTVQTNVTGGLRGFWGALDPAGQVVNWDGSLSPVVHQLDHFQDELLPLAESAITQLAKQFTGPAAQTKIRSQDRVWQMLPATRCLFDCADSPRFPAEIAAVAA